MIKTEDMDQFLRALKLFYLNHSKKFYTLMVDYLIATAVPNQSEVRIRKEVFKFIDTDSNVFNAFLLLALIMVQLLSSLQ